MRQLRRLEQAIVDETLATPTKDVKLADVSIVTLLKAWQMLIKCPCNEARVNVRNVANRLRCLGKISSKECAEIELRLAA